jgi:hypothetical protein
MPVLHGGFLKLFMYMRWKIGDSGLECRPIIGLALTFALFCIFYWAISWVHKTLRTCDVSTSFLCYIHTKHVVELVVIFKVRFVGKVLKLRMWYFFLHVVYWCTSCKKLCFTWCGVFLSSKVLVSYTLKTVFKPLLKGDLIQASLQFSNMCENNKNAASIF